MFSFHSSSGHQSNRFHYMTTTATMTEEATASRPRSKVGHTKSRTGCFKCRSRKVKCDERAPICSNCDRLGLLCQYPTVPSARRQPTRLAPDARQLPTPDSSQSSPYGTKDPSPGKAHDPNGGSDSGSTFNLNLIDKRMEVRLLHAFMSRASRGPALSIGVDWRTVWFVELPRLAMDHDNLYYSMLAFSATQVLGTPDATAEIEYARDEYWAIALQEQYKAVFTPDRHLEALALASVMIGVTVFGMLREREMDPYVPPHHRLEVSKSAWRVWPNFEDLDSSSPLLQFLAASTRQLWKFEEGTSTIIDSDLKPLLIHQFFEEMEQYGGDFAATTQIYEHTLIRLVSLKRAVETHEPMYQHVRRITLFAQIIPDEFVDFVKQGRPRALAILAYFFALAAHTNVLGVFGDPDSSIPRHEIHAINRVLPDEWRGIMMRPMDEIANLDQLRSVSPN